jgi:threonine dehydrogenase-like Zn-dependent dehydrogenase
MTTGLTINVLSGGRLARRTHPLLPPRPGGALLAVERANVCGSDVHLWRGGHPTLHDCVLGHEFVGRILRLDGQLRHDVRGQRLSEGDRVVCSYFRMCGRCAMCARGLTNLCRYAYDSWGRPSLEPPHFRGAFASHYQLHPEQAVVRVPDGVPAGLASLANCALAQGAAVVRAIRPDLVDAECLVIGAGALGLAILAAGAAVPRWDVHDRVAARLRSVRGFTNARALEDLPPVDGVLDGAYDVVAVAAGSPEAFVTALEQVRPGGQIALMGIINTRRSDTAPVRPGLITRKGITVSGVIRYRKQDLVDAVDLLSGRTPLAALRSTVYDLDDVEAALAAAERHDGVRMSLVPRHDGGGDR